jgi:hypothetical protein
MAKTLAIVFGVVFVLVGILGFVPNPLVGAGAIFNTNHLHDLVHFVFGLILLAVAFMAPAMSGMWLKILGVVYLVLAVLGFVLVPNGGSLLGLVTMNMADHLLHVVLGIVLLVAGFVGAQKTVAAMPTSGPAMPSGPTTGGTL